MSERTPPVQAAVCNRVGHLILDRPNGLNALTLNMVRLLHASLRAWADDPSILAVVLRARGGKAFCAGGDIRALYESHRAGDGLDMRFFEEEYALDQYLHAYPKPLLALMEGLTLGGGMGLVQGATFRVLTEQAKLGMPETAIGYFPDVGGTYFLSRLPGELGTYLGITGRTLVAADALHAGLADCLLPAERIAELDRRLAALDDAVAPEHALRELLAELCVPHPPAELEGLRPAIDRHFAWHDVPAIRASLRREEAPEYRAWAEATLHLLESRSPLAMAVTLESLRRGRQLSLADCFALELHLDRQWLDKGDFMEGVRALLIDKDKMPRWNPPTLEELEPQQVLAFYEGLALAR